MNQNRVCPPAQTKRTKTTTNKKQNNQQKARNTHTDKKHTHKRLVPFLVSWSRSQAATGGSAPAPALRMPMESSEEAGAYGRSGGAGQVEVPYSTAIG